MKHNYCFLITVIGIILLNGCVSGKHELRFNPEYYVENSISVGSKLMRSGIVYTTEKDDAFVYQGKADSYIGRKALFDISVGKMTKEIAVKVMGAKFKKGVKTTSFVEEGLQGSLIMRPVIIAYTYKFRMGMAGLYVVPQVDMVLNIDLIGQDNRVIYSKKYKSGLRNGEAFLSGSRAADTINKLTHETVFNLLKRTARDLENILEDMD